MSKITVEVSGPAGVGKSAVVQLIAMLLSKVELNATTHLNADLRSMVDLQVVVDALVVNKTHIEIREKHTPAVGQPTVYDARAFGRSLISASASYGYSPIEPMADWHDGIHQWTWPIKIEIEYVDSGADKCAAVVTCHPPVNMQPLHIALAILTGQAITSPHIGMNSKRILLTRYASYLFDRLPEGHKLKSHGDSTEFTFTKEDLEIV